MSVAASSSGVRHKMRATSTATFPTPTTEVGMPVVPGDKRRGRRAPLQVFARNAHALVGLGAGGENNLMIQLTQVVKGQMAPELDPTIIVEPRMRGDLVVCGGD